MERKKSVDFFRFFNNNFVFLKKYFKKMSQTFHIEKIEDWQKVVDEILPNLQHNILLLKGNLGAGKTTFSQFLLKN
jgi:predicted NACHT family NTPase